MNNHPDAGAIRAIHDQAGKFVIAASGGGASAISALLAVPGASRTVIESTVPYATEALAEYIGGTPDRACSAKTARAMAMAAFQRARRLAPEDPVFGVGCTAALTTDRARRGTDRCYVALQSLTETHQYSLAMSRASRDREAQEALCAQLVLFVIARALNIEASSPALLEDESLDEHSSTAEAHWRDLFAGELTFTNHGLAEPPAVLFPGAFNPLHAGHREMVEVARELTGHEPLLEISAFNVDKPALDFIEMHERMAGLHGFAYTFTNAPTFVDKATLFPNAVFMVGSDTLVRIGAPRYYHDSHELRDMAIDRIASLGVRFLTFGRLAGDSFVGVDDIDIPGALRAISDGVPESRFRMDMSSSAMRVRDA